MEEDNYEEKMAFATSIPELTLVCIELANKIENAVSYSEKINLVQQHIVTHSSTSIIPMVQFEKGQWYFM